MIKELVMSANNELIQEKLNDAQMRANLDSAMHTLQRNRKNLIAANFTNCTSVAFLPKRCRIRRNATPFWLFFDKNFAFSLVFYEKMIRLNLNHFVLHL